MLQLLKVHYEMQIGCANPKKGMENESAYSINFMCLHAYSKSSIDFSGKVLL